MSGHRSGMHWAPLCAAIASLVWAGLALGQEEGGTTARPPAFDPNKLSYQMKPVTADLSNSDEQRINADADQDNWRLHGRTYDNQRFSPLTEINAVQREAVEAGGADPDRRGQCHGSDADRD